jgi:hypothetical protein
MPVPSHFRLPKMTDSSAFFQSFILVRDPENQLGPSTAIHLVHAIPCLAFPTMTVKNIL